MGNAYQKGENEKKKKRLPTVHIHFLFLAEESTGFLDLNCQTSLHILSRKHRIGTRRFDSSLLRWKGVFVRLLGRVRLDSLYERMTPPKILPKKRKKNLSAIQYAEA